MMSARFAPSGPMKEIIQEMVEVAMCSYYTIRMRLLHGFEDKNVCHRGRPEV